MKNFLLVLAAVSVFAATPAGFQIWKSAELKGMGQKLSPKVDDHKVATESLAKYGNHALMVAHREGTGLAELHEKQVDILIVENGEGTLVVGGTIANSKTVSPGEIRGDSISGGAKNHIAAGDVVHIPVNTAHQVLLAPGKQITYVAVKIDGV